MAIKKNIVVAILLLTVVNGVFATIGKDFKRRGKEENSKMLGKKISTIKWEDFGKDLAIDVYEKDNDVIVAMNVPGIANDDLQVRIEDGNLHVSGRREEKKEINEEDYYHKEIKRGSFSRVVSLPGDINEGAMTWELSDGVLAVTIPKE